MATKKGIDKQGLDKEFREMLKTNPIAVGERLRNARCR
jgi:hypothetical protein